MALNLSSDVADYLVRHHVMTLATQGREGPWAAAVFYVRLGDDLIFLSSPSSRHCCNLALQPHCAATIQSDADDWHAIQGIQIEGRVTVLQGEERSDAQHYYSERFAFMRPGSAPAPLVAALARVHWYRLRISCLYFIDNRRGFGKRRQFNA